MRQQQEAAPSAAFFVSAIRAALGSNHLPGQAGSNIGAAWKTVSRRGRRGSRDREEVARAAGLRACPEAIPQRATSPQAPHLRALCFLCALCVKRLFRKGFQLRSDPDPKENSRSHIKNRGLACAGPRLSWGGRKGHEMTRAANVARLHPLTHSSYCKSFAIANRIVLICIDGSDSRCRPLAPQHGRAPDV